MSMTTPRVTVPVEPTPDMNIAGGIAICEARETAITAVDEADACYRAMLSAAPAPEGGVDGWRDNPGYNPLPGELVDIRWGGADEGRTEDDGTLSDGWAWSTSQDEDQTDYIQKWRPHRALATREEAPAEAGEEVTADGLRSVSDETMRALLSCKDVASGRAHLAAIINALRAQPPARDLASEIDDAKKTLEADGQTIEYFEAQRRVAAFKALRGTEADKRAVSYIDAAILALQAREGEAVAWRWKVKGLSEWVVSASAIKPTFSVMLPGDIVDLQPLYAAPSADKLRVAVEALEGSLPQLEVLHSIVSGKETRAIVWREITKGRQALAALQAEQKGGAE